MNPTISVIVPCYNVEQYLPKCIESILAQTYQNLEILLVDDGSPDRCGAICDEYAEKDGRIRVIHKPNGGLADARNAALDVMTGDYVVCIDSDDYVSPTHIEGMYNLANKYDAEIAVNCWCTFLDGSDPQPKVYGKERVMTNMEAIEAMFYQEMFDTCAWGKIYKSELFDGIRYPKGILFEDLPTTYKLFLKANKVAYSPEQSYYYLIRKASIEGSRFSDNKYESALKIIDIMESDKNVLAPIINSYNCRKVSLMFHILLQMPTSYKGKLDLEKRIKVVRWNVIKDKRARKITQFACMISYLGFDTIKILFKIFHSRH